MVNICSTKDSGVCVFGLWYLLWIRNTLDKTWRINISSSSIRTLGLVVFATRQNQFYWIIRTEPEAPLLCSSTGDEPVLAELALSSEEQRPAGPCRWFYRARHTSTWEQCCKIVMATHKGTSQFLHTALTWISKNLFFFNLNQVQYLCP